MLIPSARHTKSDLALWAELEAADLQRKVPNQLIEQSLAEIASHPVDYIGCSWGKDSVVLLHLVTLAKLSAPIVWVRMRGRDNPDCPAVRDAFLSQCRNINYHERMFVYEECQQEQHYKAINAEFGPHRMTGLRAEESGRRKMSIRHLGINTGKSARPLAWWKESHIFAYLAQQNLPVHPAYAMLGGGRWPREHLRTHGIGGRAASNFGRTEWEQEYYGDILRQLRAHPMSRRPSICTSWGH